jgi:hypothetical protein
LIDDKAANLKEGLINREECAAFHKIHSQRDVSLQGSFLVLSAFNLATPSLHLLKLPQHGQRYTMMWFIVETEVESDDAAYTALEELMYGELGNQKITFVSGALRKRLEELNIYLYANQTLVNEVAAAYKRHFSKVDPHWKETSQSACKDNPELYSKDCLVDLPLIIFPSRARLIQQILGCGIDVVLLDTDVMFGPKSLSQFLTSNKLFGDIFFANERGMDCDKIIPAVAWDDSQSKWEVSPSIQLRDRLRPKWVDGLEIPVCNGCPMKPKLLGYWCEGVDMNTHMKVIAPLELNCGVQVIRSNTRTISLITQWIQYTDEEIFDDQNALNALISKHMKLEDLQFQKEDGFEKIAIVPNPLTSGIAVVHSVLEPVQEQERTYTQAVSRDQVVIQVMSMRTFGVSLDLMCYGEDADDSEMLLKSPTEACGLGCDFFQEMVALHIHESKSAFALMHACRNTKGGHADFHKSYRLVIGGSDR